MRYLRVREGESMTEKETNLTQAADLRREVE